MSEPGTVTIQLVSIKRLRRGGVELKLAQPRGKRCPVCGSRLYFVGALRSYYCFNCKNYV